MKLARIALVVALVAGSVSAAKSDAAAASADTAKVQVVRDDGAKKQLHVPKPKTNWSKIKELFM